MKKATVTVSFEQEKLKAVQFYAGKNGTSLELELDMFMEKLYKKYVPSQTREYIESMAEPEEQPRPRPARSPRSAAPDTFDEKKGVEYGQLTTYILNAILHLSLINCRGGIFKPFPEPSKGAYPVVRESA